MNSKRLTIVALASAVAVCSITASKADIIYDVNLQVGATGSVTGYIQTDGFLGFIPDPTGSHFIAGIETHITNFNLLLNDGIKTYTVFDNPNQFDAVNYESEVGFAGLQFTSTGLFFPLAARED